MENWSPIAGYDGKYEVSDMGQVKNIRRNHILVPLNAKGYRRVGLYLKGSIKLVTIHSLVCAYFIGPRPEGKQINHKNGIRSDNRLENLEYCTGSENMYHSTRVLRKSSGEAHYKCRLSSEQIDKIRELYGDGHTQTKIAKVYGVTQAHISQVVRKTSRISG